MWHYVLNGKATGPVTDEQLKDLLRQGVIRETTWVWTDGMANWQEAKTVGFTEPRMPGVPPDLPTAPPLPTALPPSGSPAVATDDTSLAVLTHVLGLLTGFLGPLVILLVTTQAGIKAHARRALNWKISMFLYALVSIPLCFIFVGFLALAALGILNLIFCIMAAVKAGDRELWDYPLTIRFLKD